MHIRKVKFLDALFSQNYLNKFCTYLLSCISYLAVQIEFRVQHSIFDIHYSIGCQSSVVRGQGSAFSLRCPSSVVPLPSVFVSCMPCAAKRSTCISQFGLISQFDIPQTWIFYILSLFDTFAIVRYYKHIEMAKQT